MIRLDFESKKEKYKIKLDFSEKKIDNHKLVFLDDFFGS